jgi:nucleotide-binding universal stress UspA family protein
MKHILIALDYNPTAQKVAEIGYSLAAHNNTTVSLLHVIEDPSYYASTVYDPIMGFGGYINMNLLEPDLITALRKSTLDYLEKIKVHLGNDSIKLIVKEGDIADTILEVAKDIHANTIVMGSHSSRWLENILLGSITEKVLRHTSTPLFIIPTKKHS